MWPNGNTKEEQFKLFEYVADVSVMAALTYNSDIDTHTRAGWLAGVACWEERAL